MAKLNNIYNINDFKTVTDKNVFEKNVAHIAYEKIYEQGGTDFSSKTGFSESLVGRGINTIFSYFKKNKYKGMLEMYSRDIEDEYLVAVFRTLAEAGYTDKNITSDFLELNEKGKKYYQESKEVNDTLEFDNKVASGNMDLSEDERQIVNDPTRKKEILYNLNEKKDLLKKSEVFFTSAANVYKSHPNEEQESEFRNTLKLINPDSGIPVMLSKLDKFVRMIEDPSAQPQEETQPQGEGVPGVQVQGDETMPEGEDDSHEGLTNGLTELFTGSFTEVSEKLDNQDLVLTTKDDCALCYLYRDMSIIKLENVYSSATANENNFSITSFSDFLNENTTRSRTKPTKQEQRKKSLIDVAVRNILDGDYANAYDHILKYKSELNYNDVKNAISNPNVWGKFIKNYKKAKKKQGKIDRKNQPVQQPDQNVQTTQTQVDANGNVQVADTTQTQTQTDVQTDVQTPVQTQGQPQPQTQPQIQAQDKIDNETFTKLKILLKIIRKTSDAYVEFEDEKGQLARDFIEEFYNNAGEDVKKVIDASEYANIGNRELINNAFSEYPKIRDYVLDKMEDTNESTESLLDIDEPLGILLEADEITQPVVQPQKPRKQNKIRKDTSKDFAIKSDSVSSILGDAAVTASFPNISTAELSDKRVFDNFKLIPNGKDKATKQVNINKLAQLQLSAERLFTNKSEYLGSKTSEYSPNVRQNFIVKPADREYLERIWNKKIEVLRGKYSNYLNTSVLHPAQVLEHSPSVEKEYATKLTKPEITAVHQISNNKLSNILENVYDCSAGEKLSTGGTTGILYITIEGTKKDAHGKTKSYDCALVADVVEMNNIKSIASKTKDSFKDTKGYRVKGIIDVDGLTNKYGTDYTNLVSKQDAEKKSVIDQFINNRETESIKQELFGDLDFSKQLVMLVNKNALNPSSTYTKHPIVVSDIDDPADFLVMKYINKKVNTFNSYVPKIKGEPNVNYVSAEIQVIQTYHCKNKIYWTVPGILNIDDTALINFGKKMTDVVNANDLNGLKFGAMFDPKPGKEYNKAYSEAYMKVYP